MTLNRKVSHHRRERTPPSVTAAMNFAVKLAVELAVLVALLAQLSLAILSQQSYLIRGRKIENVVDAVIQTRHFLKNHLDKNQRCKHLALLLNAYNLKRDNLNYFQTAGIGILSDDEVNKEFNEIGVEKLRNLYMDGVLKFIENDQVNGAMVEVYRCLSDGFLNRDARVQVFLKNNNIKQIIEQYESFAKQPIRLLVDDSEKHSELKLGELNPSIKKSLARLFGGDESKLGKLFHEEEEKVQEHHYEDPRPTSPQTQHIDQAGASQGLPAPSYEPQDLPQGHHGHHEQQPPQQHQRESSSNEDFGQLLRALVSTYESLPHETTLNDRCRTYRNLIEAEREDLYREGFLEEQISQAARRIGTKPSEDSFVPVETTRQNFLFILQIFDPFDDGMETWIDLLYCVRTWETIDKNVRDFMNDPMLANTIGQLEALSREDQTRAQPQYQTAPQPNQHPVV